jgi:DinB family protein
MLERPGDSEAAPFYFTYINQVAGGDPFGVVESQLEDALGLFATISEERSLRQCAPDKWSIRQVLNHVTDTERAFAFRLLWFARGFEAPLPGYDQDIAAAGAEADAVSWAAHVEEFRQVRLATISLYRNMPAAGWTRSGIASDKFVTTRALGWIIPGHVAHHLTILRERYL